jgi:hypothetical protein
MGRLGTVRLSVRTGVLQDDRRANLDRQLAAQFQLPGRVPGDG